ncbi:50S ribosomal protein L17 [Bacteroidota bacterium]
MASSLIIHKRITTTVAKAKALRKYVEPLITKAKEDTTHSRRVIFSYLQDKESVKALFNEVAEKAAERPGGYTRIIKTGSRLGDNAQMCMIELVDFNELLLEEKADKKAKTRRGRRGKFKKSEPAKAETVTTTEAEEVAEVETTEEQVDEATAPVEEVIEEKEEVKAEAEDVSEVKDEVEVEEPVVEEEKSEEEETAKAETEEAPEEPKAEASEPEETKEEEEKKDDKSKE